GEPLKVSEEPLAASPPVTLSFIPAAAAGDTKNLKATSYSAKFDQQRGTYTVELPPGQYRTMIILALPAGPGKLNPQPPLRPEKQYDLTRDQELDIEVPAK